MSKVVVAHPNIQHSLQLAVALQDSDLLQAYVTRLYLSENHPPLSAFKWLPKSSRQKIEEMLAVRFRRSHIDLDPENVLTIDTWPVLALIAQYRSGLLTSKQWNDRLFDGTVQFQEKVVDILRRVNGRALVCYDRFASVAFQGLEHDDRILILDLSVAHPGTTQRILLEERELVPEFADTLSIPGITDGSFSQCVEETSRADYILAGSSFVKDSCVENGVDARKIFTLPYGTDMVHLEPSIKEQDDAVFRVLFAGQIGQRKGISYLLQAFEKLNLADAELWLAGHVMGNGDALDPYCDMFKYLGYVPHSQMPEIYSQVDLFVLPTLVEGLSQVCLEAMARGKPVITTPNSGMEGILRDGRDGFIVPIRDVDALTEKIQYFYENREDCITMGRSARERIGSYSWRYYREEAQKDFAAIL
jgi:starch synthase